MESLPIAAPDLSGVLTRLDRGTAELLALQPRAPAGATAPPPFAALLQLLTAGPQGGEGLPVSGNALPVPGEAAALAADLEVECAEPLQTVPAPYVPATPAAPPAAAPLPTAAASSAAPALLIELHGQRPADPGLLAPSAATLPHGAPQTTDAPPPADTLQWLDDRSAAPARNHANDGRDTPAAPRTPTQDVPQRAAEPLAAWLQQRAMHTVPEVVQQRSMLRSAALTELSFDEAAVPEARGADAPHRAILPSNVGALATVSQVTGVPAPAQPGGAALAAVADHGAAAQPSFAVTSSSTPAMQQPGAFAPPDPTAAQNSPGPVDLGAPRWNEALANRIHFMIDHDVGEARIKLNPPELGALDVKIAMHDDKTYVQLAAASAAARDELTQNLPRLRELLAMSGLNLGGATVSDGGHGREPKAPDAPFARTLPASDLGAESSPALPRVARSTARIDLYA
jgi:flagellar hook-length control protein FliK